MDDGGDGCAAAYWFRAKDESPPARPARRGCCAALSGFAQAGVQGSRYFGEYVLDLPADSIRFDWNNAVGGVNYPGCDNCVRYKLSGKYRTSHVRVSAGDFFSFAGGIGCRKLVWRHGIEPWDGGCRLGGADRYGRHIRYRAACRQHRFK